MPNGTLPYRARSPRRSPYAAAWREYAWRRHCGRLLGAAWLLGLLALAWRFRAWFIVILFPAPLTALCLRGFRCPRCDQRFAESESGWWGTARVERCVHCGLARGAPADPDEYAASTSAN
ncbi:MAG TPA: hypothetical protein VFU02_05155 [Polyangiaceae bacterium]|nr:hypothetical protein [Polyangiaceae bacterium]